MLFINTVKFLNEINKFNNFKMSHFIAVFKQHLAALQVKTKHNILITY